MEPKWLELAREELGTEEIPGPKSNPRILAYYEDSGNKGVYEDSTTAWCAALVGAMLKRSGLPNTGSLAARSYLNYGIKLDKPKLGCIVVFKRGNSTWEGHVAFYLGETETTVKVLGGNQSNKVSIASYSKSKLLGYRWPVEPTVAALKAAGSEEIQSTNNVQNALIATGGVTSAVKIADESGAIDQLKNVSDNAGVVQHAMEGLHAVVKFAVGNLWIVVLVGCIALYIVNRQRIKARIAKHMAGIPIFRSQ